MEKLAANQRGCSSVRRRCSRTGCSALVGNPARLCVAVDGSCTCFPQSREKVGGDIGSIPITYSDLLHSLQCVETPGEFYTHRTRVIQQGEKNCLDWAKSDRVPAGAGQGDAPPPPPSAGPRREGTETSIQTAAAGDSGLADQRRAGAARLLPADVDCRKAPV